MAVMEPKRNAAMFVTDVTVMLMPPLRSACRKRSCKAQTPLTSSNLSFLSTPRQACHRRPECGCLARVELQPAPLHLCTSLHLCIKKLEV